MRSESNLSSVKMRTFTCLVLIVTLMGIANSWLIVPFWEDLEEPSEEIRIPKKVELEGSDDQQDDQRRKQGDLARYMVAFMTSPYWQALSQKQKKMMAEIFMVMMHGPKFSPFGG